ncbi:MAG: MerR family transcriptional regulator [Massilia sp.]|nr:MerR family transcriptional regulator [Massilia sp.]
MINSTVTTSDLAPQSDNAEVAGGYRSGVAARLAGLPVETLRVWERRYNVSDTGRSPHGQRLYSDAQVRRLGLIKQLVDQGHQIGSLARLPTEQLRQLMVTPQAPSSARPIRVALVGNALARRLAGGGRELMALDVVGECPSLDGAAVALLGSGAEVLLIDMSELADSALPAIAPLRDELGAAVVVLYRFGASAAIRQLRLHGCLVARSPADPAEIVLLCQAALAAGAAPAAAPAPSARAPRRFDDAALATLAAASTNVACECPHHLAELLLMLTSFERYSVQCAARTPADALLHQELGHAADQAHRLLEVALERVARAEGLLPPSGL